MSLALVRPPLNDRIRWQLVDTACAQHPFYVRRPGRWHWIDPTSPEPTQEALLSWFTAHYQSDAERIARWETEREQRLARRAS